MESVVVQNEKHLAVSVMPSKDDQIVVVFYEMANVVPVMVEIVVP